MAVAAMMQVMRERDPSLARLTRLEMVINSIFPGFSFGSELFLVIGMWIEDPALGASMFIFRLMHMVGAILLVVVTYGKKRLAANFDWLVRDVSRLREKIDDDFSSTNTYFVACVTILGLCDITMLQFLPWKASRFYTLSEGFPSLGMMKLCLIIKMVQSAVSVICQVTYLAKTSDLNDPTTTAQAKALFGMNIVVSTVGVFLWFLLWVLKGGRLLKAEGSVDLNGDGGNIERATVEKKTDDPELTDVYNRAAVSMSAINPLHGIVVSSSRTAANAGSTPTEVSRGGEDTDIAVEDVYATTNSDLSTANPIQDFHLVETAEPSAAIFQDRESVAMVEAPSIPQESEADIRSLEDGL